MLMQEIKWRILYMKSYLHCKTIFMWNHFHKDKFVGEFNLDFKNLPKINYLSNFYKIFNIIYCIYYLLYIIFL